MKQKILLVAFIILHFTFHIWLVAEDTWIQTYQPFGDVNYYPEDIIVCQDSGYTVNGYYYYYDLEFGIEEEWGFLIKTDSDGNMLWAKLDTLNLINETRSYAFVEISDGGFISACSSGILIKRNSEGSRDWVIDENFGINSMCNTEDGNIILGGAQNLNIGLRKIDENGNTLWTQVYPINDDYSICKSIIQTNDGGYVLTGYLDYEGRQPADILVMKTDANGDSLWTRTFDGYGFWDSGKSITEDSNGNIMIAGEICNPNTVGFLWYLDEDGNTIWTQEVESSVGHSHFSILSLPDNSFTTYSYSGSGENREITIYNFDNSYNVTWLSEFDSNVAKGDNCISFLAPDQYVCALRDVGGIFENNIGIAKTDLQGQVVSIDEFEIPTTNEITLTNFPNPFNPETKISFNLPVNIENPIIEIFNIKGEKIRTINYQNQIPITWDGTDNFRNQVSSGIYLYRLKANSFISKTKKMTLLK